MISALTGQLRRVDEDRVHLQAGPLLLELLVPAADVAELGARLNESITFHTVFYLEGDAARGNLEPRLIGFLRPEDRRFFGRFTTVKGIGPKTALKAFTVPVGQIAHAIENKDTKFLLRLKGVGKRTAELIVAELSGKLQGFVLDHAEHTPLAPNRRDTYEEDAIGGLMALGEPRLVAERLLDHVKQANPQLNTTDGLLREMLRVRTGRG